MILNMMYPYILSANSSEYCLTPTCASSSIVIQHVYEYRSFLHHWRIMSPFILKIHRWRNNAS